LALGVAAHDDGFVTHPRYEIVARLRDLALVADEQPGAAEQTFKFFLMKLGRDKDLAADQPALRVDQLIDRQRRHAPVLRNCGDCAAAGERRPGALPALQLSRLFAAAFRSAKHLPTE